MEVFYTFMALSWLILIGVVIYQGTQREIGPVLAAMFAILTTPYIAIIIVVCSPTLETLRYRRTHILKLNAILDNLEDMKSQLCHVANEEDVAIEVNNSTNNLANHE